MSGRIRWAIMPVALLGLAACDGGSSAAKEASTTTAASTTTTIPGCNDGDTVQQGRWICVNGRLIANPDGPTVLQDASKCLHGDETTDGGDTLVLEQQGEDDYTGLEWEYIECVLEWLDVPDRVMAHIGDTRALDGQQTDSWDDLEARWTYHPDDGLEMTIWLDA